MATPKDEARYVANEVENATSTKEATERPRATSSRKGTSGDDRC